ncbi:hypothetical protein C1H46_016945 [Malus baccata]|uniref:Uncharacterized protein n=1 Tax=Malus baccata TaxID=106549 RepID=A0A540MF47_MALBA|nr:hypothetical protein C1H46_016945 [Malus baccata]
MAEEMMSGWWWSPGPRLATTMKSDGGRDDVGVMVVTKAQTCDDSDVGIMEEIMSGWWRR